MTEQHKRPPRQRAKPQVSDQPKLFDMPAKETSGRVLHETSAPPAEKGKGGRDNALAKSRQITPRPRTGLFGKAMLADAVEFLPQVPDTRSVDEITAFLRERLHYSAAATRLRNANYIVKRMFLDGYADQGLLAYARLFPNRQELRDACFYRFCRAEPLMYDVIDEVVRPSLSRGVMKRKDLRDYLARRFPDSKSIKDCAQAIVDVLIEANVAGGSKTEVVVGQREILLPSLAFVLHSEFSRPGMYDIALLESNRANRAMLWDPSKLLPSLYELRNLGFLPKVSEIDRVRQFTVRMDLDDVIGHLAQGKSDGPKAKTGSRA